MLLTSRFKSGTSWFQIEESKLPHEAKSMNGYRLVYRPEHPEQHFGYVYEHRVIAQAFLGRPLAPDEVVHHLDQDRGNNRVENLLVLLNSQHTKLHEWLKRGSAEESADELRVNSKKATGTNDRYCYVCGESLQAKQQRFCSNSCRGLTKRRTERPSKEVLEVEILQFSWEALSRKYGVSGNAIRKWARAYGIPTLTLSQAPGTPGEGAETTGCG